MAYKTCCYYWGWSKVCQNSVGRRPHPNELITWFSGLLVYRELTQAGFDVKLFERDNVPGGNWHFTDEAPAGVSIPNANLLVADFEPSLPSPGEKLPYEEHYYGEESRTKRRDLRGPKPIWKSLTSNVPAVRWVVFSTSNWSDMPNAAYHTGQRLSLVELQALILLQFTELPWPRGTPWGVYFCLVSNIQVLTNMAKSFRTRRFRNTFDPSRPSMVSTATTTILQWRTTRASRKSRKDTMNPAQKLGGN